MLEDRNDMGVLGKSRRVDRRWQGEETRVTVAGCGDRRPVRPGGCLGLTVPAFWMAQITEIIGATHNSWHRPFKN